MPRVLIVDDEPDAVEFLRGFLTAKGYEVLAASNGENAQRRVKEERPHLILLDVRLPDMNGLEVLRQVDKSTMRWVSSWSRRSTRRRRAGKP
jgi:DNA-binding response OmpR family regulator